MFDFLDKIPYSILIPVAAFLLIAPVVPMPHALEKLIMLKNGTLKRPIDIFDLIMHATPAVLLAICSSLRGFGGSVQAARARIATVRSSRRRGRRRGRRGGAAQGL